MLPWQHSVFFEGETFDAGDLPSRQHPVPRYMASPVPVCLNGEGVDPPVATENEASSTGHHFAYTSVNSLMSVVICEARS